MGRKKIWKKFELNRNNYLPIMRLAIFSKFRLDGVLGFQLNEQEDFTLIQSSPQLMVVTGQLSRLTGVSIADVRV